jgi:NAD+---dinitrogen-reductase ADP-D-ribosyltransferase
MKENSPPEGGAFARSGTDNDKEFVGVATTKNAQTGKISLPRCARLPINRCSIPAVILGSLAYQRHPVPLTLDGVVELHKDLFQRLDIETDPHVRAEMFQRHMAAAFSLEQPEEAGWAQDSPRDRSRASYLKMVRGWSFDADGREGAVLKGWVESRFGLLPRHHGGPIRDFSGETYRRYLGMRAQGLYGTNALEAQLDLLYTYCQYELGRQRPGETHLTLYRGVNRAGEHETLKKVGPRESIVLMNSLSSFTPDRMRAGEFGDNILEVNVPLPKVFFFHHLLPGMLKGEEEFVVIGGVYEASFALM